MTDKNLGHATAYGYAKSKGYTGTEEEFAELMASYAEVAESAKGYAEQAEASATNAETSASNAQASATSAGTSASSASASAQTASTKASEASDSATSASESASTAVSAKDDAVMAKEEAETAKADAETAAEEAQESAQTVANKADKDGTYPDMTVGNVFSDDSYTSDQTPYLYRVSGGGVEVGKVEADKIVGGSIVWNQLVSIPSAPKTQTLNNVTITDNRDGTYSVSTTSEGASSLTQVVVTTISSGVKEHTMLIGGNPSNSSGTTAFIVDTWSGQRYIKDSIHKITSSGIAVTIEVQSGAVITTPMVFKPQMHDLTSLFGTTIADYLYSLETATEGSGVSLFRKLFPNAYYPYNAGELMHVSGMSEHVMRGKNLFPSTGWEFGQYTNGVWTEWSARITSPFIPIYPNVQYTFTIEQDLAWINFNYFDENKTWLGSRNENGDPSFNGNRTYTTTITNGNARYIRLTARSYADSSADISGYDIANAKPQLEIGSTATSYVPYRTPYTYPLDSSLTLRGIPKLDANNNLYYDGDVYTADGKVQRKYGIVDLGSLAWKAWTGYAGVYRTSLPSNCKTMPNNNTLPNWVAPIYKTVIGTDISSNNKTIGQLHQTYLVVHDDSYSSASDFKTAMNGVYLVYELATPTEETAQAYTEYQKVSKYGTEEYVSTGIVPVGHVTKYPTDIVAKVNGLPSDFSTLIAPTETGFKATRAYSVNQFIIVTNQLYRVTASIANGATITVGTNVVATTVADILTALLNA